MCVEVPLTIYAGLSSEWQKCILICCFYQQQTMKKEVHCKKGLMLLQAKTTCLYTAVQKFYLLQGQCLRALSVYLYVILHYVEQAYILTQCIGFIMTFSIYRVVKETFFICSVCCAHEAVQTGWCT